MIVVVAAELGISLKKDLDLTCIEKEISTENMNIKGQEKNQSTIPRKERVKAKKNKNITVIELVMSLKIDTK